MKTKKFTFKQTVFSKVKTEFTYKIEAKNYEEAEELLKTAFMKKVSKGKQFSAIKKLDPKVEVVYEIPLMTDEVGTSTLKVELINNKKESRMVHELYNNYEDQWTSYFEETISETKQQEESKKEK